MHHNTSNMSQTNLVLSDLTITEKGNSVDTNFRKEQNTFEQFMQLHQQCEDLQSPKYGFRSPNYSNFRESQLATTRKFLNQTRQNSLHKSIETTEASLQQKPIYHKCQSVANTTKYINKEQQQQIQIEDCSEPMEKQQDKKSFRCEVCKTCFSPQQLLKSLEKNYQGENKSNEMQLITSPNCKQNNKQNSIRTCSTIEIEQQLKQVATTRRSHQLPNQFPNQELQKHISVLNSPEMKLKINKLVKQKSNQSQMFTLNKKLFNELSSYSNLGSPLPQTSTNNSNLKEINLNIKQNSQIKKKISFNECSNEQSKENIQQKSVKHHFNAKQFAKKIEFVPGSPSFEQLDTSKKYAICQKL